MQRFPSFLTQYEIVRTVGASKYTSAYLARCIPNGKMVALKKIELEQCPLNLEQIWDKLKIWASFENDNCVKYIGSFLNETDLFLILEYVDGGSISDIMKYKYLNGFTDEMKISSIIKDILSFLSYLHENCYAGCKLCADKMLVTLAGKVKMNDFENIKQYPKKSDVLKQMIQEDIRNVGNLVIELCTGKAGKTIAAINHMSPLLKDFVRKCLNNNRKGGSANGKTTNKNIFGKVKNLLEHCFITQKKIDNYLCVSLMMNLPPLDQRLQVIKNPRNSCKIMKGRSISCSERKGSLVLIPLRKCTTEQRGRFTIIRNMEKVVSGNSLIKEIGESGDVC